jgi:hypothetical protein
LVRERLEGLASRYETNMNDPAGQFAQQTLPVLQKHPQTAESLESGNKPGQARSRRADEPRADSR